MIGAIRSEFRKYFSTRLWWGMAAGIVAAAALFTGFLAFVFIELAPEEGGPGMPMEMEPVQLANSVYTAGLSVAYVLMLTIGVLQIGAEYRHKTITATFLTTPKRLRALNAKAIALIGIAVVNGLLSVITAVVVGAAVMGALGADPFPSTEVFRTMALSLLVLAVWALIGLGIGILIPNQVAALIIAVGVAWIVEPIVSLGLSFWDWGAQHIVQYLPTQATSSAINTVDALNEGAARLPWWGGALTLVAYAVVLAGFGIWRASREDVS